MTTKPHRHKTPLRHGQAGMSLIEVLVAVLIFSFGLVGLIGLQARALQVSTGAEDTSRAALLANEMATVMVSQQTMDTTALASAITAWQARVRDATVAGLPSGAGTVSVDTTTGVATITVKWTPPSAASAAVPAQNQYVTQVVLPS
jgi:type IV pilus assembly protein PilV